MPHFIVDTNPDESISAKMHFSGCVGTTRIDTWEFNCTELACALNFAFDIDLSSILDEKMSYCLHRL